MGTQAQGRGVAIFWRRGALLRCAVAGGAVLIAVAALSREASAPLPKPLTDTSFRSHSAAKVRLGQALFYDKILSGRQNIACGSCHDHSLASADGLSLSLGEGAIGLGPKRRPRHAGDAVEHRAPRNAPALFNLGAKEIRSVFWDGRLELAPTTKRGFSAPREFELPTGLDSLTAAQALFPIASEIEMAGGPRESEVGLAAARSPMLAWREIEKRLRKTPAYWPLFAAAYPELKRPEDIRIVDIANALGAFIETEWRADQSPFDRFLRGDRAALSPTARAGAALFYGAAGCAGCHSGPLLTDQKFHAIAMPQIGPGRMPKMIALVSDFGRMEATGDLRDAYRFRTPSLRNVAKTAPYGHSGAYATLDAVVRHHLNPPQAFAAYSISQAVLPHDPALAARDGKAMADARERAAILGANVLAPKKLSDAEIAAIIAFLEALTDEASLKGRLGKPSMVPSGLKPD
ncbi:MAG: c-type cytochrome [Neomegalonema sp.]|nr:c-type cytochrome [Neomegalonema sp.]